MTERALVHRALTDVILELPEPYRVALLHRYFEDLPPREIAKRLGVPVATVHTRILRGRERLRRALVERFGSNAAWCAAFVDWIVPPRRSPLGPLLQASEWGRQAALLVGLTGVAFVCGLLVYTVFDASSESELGRRTGVAARGGGGSGEPGDDRPPSDARERLGFAAASDRTTAGPSADGASGAEREARPEVEPDSTAMEDPRGGLVLERAPPGLVFVEGGRTWIGSEASEIAKLARKYPEDASAFAVELEAHRQEVADFFLMVTEVTVEQYAVFVEATTRALRGRGRPSPSRSRGRPTCPRTSKEGGG